MPVIPRDLLPAYAALSRRNSRTCRIVRARCAQSTVLLAVDSEVAGEFHVEAVRVFDAISRDPIGVT